MKGLITSTLYDTSHVCNVIKHNESVEWFEILVFLLDVLLLKHYLDFVCLFVFTGNNASKLNWVIAVQKMRVWTVQCIVKTICKRNYQLLKKVYDWFLKVSDNMKVHHVYTCCKMISFWKWSSYSFIAIISRKSNIEWNRGFQVIG